MTTSCIRSAHWGRYVPQADHVRGDDRLLHVKVRGQQIVLRAGSMTDWVVVEEVLVKDEYDIAGLPGDLGVVVDCGANIGLFSVAIGSKARRLVLVEPGADNVRMARRNVELAGLDAGIEQAALAPDGTGPLTFQVYANAQGNNTAVGKHGDKFGECEEVQVPTLSLDALFEKHGIDQCGLLKCDIEGGEYAIFDAVSPGVLGRIQRIVMECHYFDGANDLRRMQALRDKLQAAGFEVEAEPPEKPDGSLRPHTYLSAIRLAR